MEKLGRAGKIINDIYNHATAKALGIVLKVHKGTGSNLPPMLSAARRLVVDGLGAHASVGAVDNFARLEQLKSLGMSEAKIANLILGLLVLDYVLPPVLIFASYPIINELVDMPAAIDATASFLAGRAVYGIGTGLMREIMYTSQESVVDLPAFWRATEGPVIADDSPRLPWYLGVLSDTINLDQTPIDLGM